MKVKIDIHRHVLGIEHVAKGMFGKISEWIMKKPTKRLHILSHILKFGGKLIPGRDGLERLSRLLVNIDLSTEQKIQLALKDADMICIYAIDMENCEAGEVEVSYAEQIEELIALKKKGYNIKIFMHLDNNRPDLFSFAAKYQEHVDGWKLYPPLSGYPDDLYIDSILTLWPKPVAIHCTDSSPIFFHGYVNDNDMSQKEKCQIFGDPTYIVRLAKKHPEVNFNLCHGGGNNTAMRLRIINICRTLPNCFTESSYEDNKQFFNEIYSKIPKKCLFGSDAIMCDFFTLEHMEQLQENNRTYLKL